jgi:hypothetical protein
MSEILSQEEIDALLSAIGGVFLSESVNGLDTCLKGLLSNIVRYTPLQHLDKMLANEKNIPVFNSYNFDSFYKTSHVFKEL